MVGVIRVGIITFHHGYNYGGFLQVYCLQTYLQNIGTDVSVINYINPTHRLRKISKMFHPRRVFQISQELKKAKDFNKIHKEKLRLTPHISDCSNISELGIDVVVLGSDEIWNFNNMMFGLDRCYYGSGFEGKNKISYAASFGPRRLDEDIPLCLASDLGALNHISVRDRNSFKFIKKITGEEVPIVADPTFLVNIMEQAVQPDASKEYALIYGAGFDRQQLKDMRNEANKRGLELISVGYKVPSDRFVPNISPFEWIGWLSNATIVFTSMFHGLVFSLLGQREFVFFRNDYRNNKVDSIGPRLGITDRFVSTGTTISKALQNNIDYSKINQKIKSHKEESIDYLKKAIVK